MLPQKPFRPLDSCLDFFVTVKQASQRSARSTASNLTTVQQNETVLVQVDSWLIINLVHTQRAYNMASVSSNVAYIFVWRAMETNMELNKLRAYATISISHREIASSNFLFISFEMFKSIKAFHHTQYNFSYIRTKQTSNVQNLNVS